MSANSRYENDYLIVVNCRGLEDFDKKCRLDRTADRSLQSLRHFSNGKKIKNGEQSWQVSRNISQDLMYWFGNLPRAVLSLYQVTCEQTAAVIWDVSIASAQDYSRCSYDDPY